MRVRTLDAIPFRLTTHLIWSSLSSILASRFLLNFRQVGGRGVLTELSQFDLEDATFSTAHTGDRCPHLEGSIALANLSRPRIVVQKDVSVHIKVRA